MKNRINSALETLLSEIYKEKGISTGDITPEQSLQWDNIVNEISELFEDLIKQNQTQSTPKAQSTPGNMEIARMLTLSTAHIKEETANFLNDESRECLTVYPKLEFGWFIFLDTKYFEDELKLIPEDLAAVLKYAKESGCEWLCLDSDGPITADLPQYDW